ncbi:bHLH transcription factor binding [Homalodisca vitripennis]|nr:bHLH transcription factor binding [Homalodisca vitripennis]
MKHEYIVFTFHCLLQYGSDEFGQDSPRYTSPKASAALYASDPYYLDSGAGPGDPWTGGGGAGQLQAGGGAGYPGGYTAPAQTAQGPSPYTSNNIHLPHDNMGYGALSPNGASGSTPTVPPPPPSEPLVLSGAPLSSGPALPPMSSFRGPSGAQSPAGILYPSHSPVVQSSGDTLGKALASFHVVIKALCRKPGLHCRKQVVVAGCKVWTVRWKLIQDFSSPICLV